MEVFFPGCNHSTKCIDDNEQALPQCRPRGSAGTSIIWHNDIDHLVEPLLDGSDRLNAVIVHSTPQPTIIINTYMPTIGAANADYEELLDEVFEVVNKYSSTQLVWTGDINAAAERQKPTANDNMLKKFCQENCLEISKHMPKLPTFYHFNGKSTSTIDLFIHRASEDPFTNITIDERSPLNTSTHDPVTAVLSSSLNSEAKKPVPVKVPKKIHWNKVDKAAYKDNTDVRLQPLMNQMEDIPASILADRVNAILSNCATEAHPPPPKRRRKTKYRWQATFRPLSEKVTSTYKSLQQLRPTERPHSAQNQAHRAAKKLLRKAQRQAAAKRRNDIKAAIIDTCKKKGRDGFYKLVENQQKSNNRSKNIDFGPNTDPDSQANSWANYFKDLATPKEDETFDEEYHQYLKVTYLLQVLTSSGEELKPVTESTIMKHINSMKSGKAADIYGITAEHIKFSSPLIIKVLCHLTNMALATGKLPPTYKLGAVTPVPKKSKPPKQPGNYRRITITSIVGKVVEKQMIAQLRPTLDRLQSRLQFGFSKGISPIYAAVVLTEIMAEAKDCKEELHITFMDTSKAFDVVSHIGMLNALHEQGISDNTWHLFDSLYDETKSIVKWDGTTSDAFEEGQGIKQGGPSSTDCYKGGKNKLLKNLDDAPALKIGHINVGAVMVADDLALASRTVHDMQAALNMAQADASKERYKFNTDKTKTISINSKNPPHLMLNGKPLGSSTKEPHLGLQRTTDNSNKDTVCERIKQARRAAFKLRGAGLVGLVGVGPEVATIEYATYIIPTLLYGLEALTLERKDMDKLELYHRKNLRYIQHLPQSTAVPAIYLLTGIPPVEATIHIRTLCLFRNILDADENSPQPPTSETSPSGSWR